jgi:hypothetical protein
LRRAAKIFQFSLALTLFPLFLAGWGALGEQIPVHHIEGVSLGFLVLRDESGTPIAYGDLQQVVKKGYVMDDLTFKFKDGSFYEEITKFTQRGVFRLVSDQVVQRGPSFKQQLESWTDASTGNVRVRWMEDGKEKDVTKHLDLPADLANGMLIPLAKNLDPSAPKTAVSMVVGSNNPQLVKLNFSPEPEALFHVGPIRYKAQHYRVKIEIEGIKGKIAPLVGKQPDDIHLWLIKSESPTFVKFRGQLYRDGPIWQMELADPREGPPERERK